MSASDASPDTAGPLGAFSREEIQRYARHFSLEEVGPEGQARLCAARVLLVGAGGLGSPAALYLAAAGVGTLGIVDADEVDLSNLQRQILHGTPDVGRPKIDSARERLAGINPHVDVRTHHARLTSENAREIIGGYDLVIDGSDNFPTRYLVNDACVLMGLPWVYGAILRWEGQLAMFGAPVREGAAGEDTPREGATGDGAARGPCYRCLFAEPPPPGLVPGCAEAGVVGVLPGIIGSLQALEAVKWILGEGKGMAGRLLIFDALDLSFREIALQRRADCPVCGDAPTIHELIDYEHFCATGEQRPAGAEEAGVATGAAEAPTDEIAPAELDERLRNGEPAPLLLDVREPWEWEVSNLSAHGARHVPLRELEAALASLPRDRDVVVYCRTGGRSARAVERLREEGLTRARNLAGGLRRWARDVDPDLPVA